jgi:cystathionine gamma-synthase
MAVVQALRPGDHVVAPAVMYWGLRNYLVRYCRDWGLGLSLFDPGDPDDLARKADAPNTRLVWLETPCNPTWDVIDIARAAGIARTAGAHLAVDSTVATPVLSRPLELGADVVMHSATKYLNGHGDVVAGALATARDDVLWQRIRDIRANAGALLGSFEAWLLARGMRTLFLRVRRASESALRIATHFEHHPRVAQVLYPGLPAHPGHEVARRQMHGGFGGMLSLRVRGGESAALTVARRCRTFIRATSLGGVESLIEHRYSIEGPAGPVPPDLLRLSVGIEAVEDLIADLERALG